MFYMDFYIAPDKRRIQRNVILFCYDNMRCEYSTELPWQGASNEYPQYVFVKNKKNVLFS